MGVLCVCGRLGGANDSDAHAQMQFLHLHSIPIKLKIVGGSFPPFNLNFWDLRGIWGCSPQLGEYMLFVLLVYL